MKIDRVFNCSLQFFKEFGDICLFYRFYAFSPQKAQIFLLLGKNGILKSEKIALFLQTQWAWLAEVMMAICERKYVGFHIITNR